MEEMKEKLEIEEDQKTTSIPVWTSNVSLLRKQYWKLQQARDEDHSIDSNGVSGKEQPVTCFLYPSLTPNKLLEHLTDQDASDACILEWMRRLQALRQQNSETDACTKQLDLDKSYGVELLGK